MEKRSFIEQCHEVINSTIGIVSPKIELQRRLLRQAQKVALRGSYEGGRNDRNRKPWFPRGGSADEDLLDDLPLLRERSRDLIRNDPVAAGIIETMVSNIVGHGHYPQSDLDGKKLGLSEQRVEEIGATLEEGWEAWSMWADTANRMTFWEMQQMVIRQIASNGDLFALREAVTDEPWRPFNYALNLVEGDRIDTPSDKRSQRNIRRGVEIGTRGQPLAYWVCRTHPGDVTYTYRTPEAKEYVRYPVMSEYGQRNATQLYFLKRPGQTRGEPMLSPVLNKFKDMGEFGDATLMAAKLAACFGIVIETTSAGNPYNAAAGASDEAENGQRLESIYPAMIERLKAGEKMTQVNPSHPGPQFESYYEQNMRMIGSGVNMPYELVFKDFSKSNFSSSRAAILEVRKYFKCFHIWLCEKFCQPVYETVVEEMFLRNQIDVPDFYENKKYYTKTRWLSPGWAYIEPEKEIEAAISAIDNNLSTASQEIAARGGEWTGVFKQRALERKTSKNLGLPETPGMSKTATVTGPIQKNPPAQQGQEDGQAAQGDQE